MTAEERLGKEETKEQVLKAARELGYCLSARTLNATRTYGIGVLFVDQSNSGLTHDYFSKVLDSFKMEVEEHGYDLTFINCSKTRSGRMSYLEHSRYRGVDGVVIACVDFTMTKDLTLISGKCNLGKISCKKY